MILPFESTMNFFDPHLTSDGRLYGPFRFKELIKERYLISNYTNISYTETGLLSPVEREYISNLVLEDLSKKYQQLESKT